MKDDFNDCKQENAHFIFADMMISTIEKMKSQILMQTELNRILLKKVPDTNSSFNLVCSLINYCNILLLLYSISYNV